MTRHLKLYHVPLLLQVIPNGHSFFIKIKFHSLIENQVILNTPLKTPLKIYVAVLPLISKIQKAAINSSIANHTITQKYPSQLVQHTMSQLVNEKRRARSK